MRVGIFYGSTTGAAQSVADLIAQAFSGEKVEVKQAGEFSADTPAKYDLLILGSSTWGDGELQDDWLLPVEILPVAQYGDCKVAVFGVGDGNGWADTFADAMKILYDKVVEGGAAVIGTWPVDDYDFSESQAVVDGKFVGLAIDESNQSDLTGGRVSAWVVLLKSEMASQPV